MAEKILWKENKAKFNIELSEGEILKRAKKDLIPIQENLTEKKITIDDAKKELQKINEWLQWTNLEQKDKKEIWKAFEKLTSLEKNIDEETLKNEVDEIINLLETLTKKDLAQLKQDIQRAQDYTRERPKETQEWIKESSKNLASTINDASQDKNPIAQKIGERMKRLMS